MNYIPTEFTYSLYFYKITLGFKNTLELHNYCTTAVPPHKT